MDGPREIELKLDLDPADAARVMAHPVLHARAGAQPDELLLSTYYDTPDFALRRAGVYLRVRDKGGRFIQTIKSAASEVELLERLEWEHELPGPAPDLAAAEGTALAPLLTPEVRAALRPLFETRIRRSIHIAECDDATVEVAIDEGEIVSGTRFAPVSEVELELKRGEAAALFQLARKLGETVPLRLAVKTKAERGFELVEGGGRLAEKARDLEIAPDASSAEAFRAIARNCLRQIIVNEPGTVAGQPEALHQMRIGLRRLRAAIALFDDIVAGDERDRIVEALRWAARELGPARELDVFAADVLPLLSEEHSDPETAAATQREFKERYAAAYARARASVRSDRFRVALLDLAEWVEVGAWAHDADEEDEDGVEVRGDRPVKDLIKDELTLLRKQIRKRGAKLTDLGVGALHKLRIRAKRLRYATEFFAGTFAGDKARARRAESLAALKDLQDALGGLNDLATHKTLLGAGDAESTDAHAWRKDPAAKSLLADAQAAYARFAKVKPFWKT
jgi:inorganic triphosphatase YgiF